MGFRCEAAELGRGAVLLALLLVSGAPARPAGLRHDNSYGNLPLAFEANHGQTDPAVRFLARGGGYAVFLTQREAVLSLRPPAAGGASRALVRMRWTGAAPESVEGLDPLPGRSHYFIGSDPRHWRRNVSSFARVRYRRLYPGVDLVFYGHGGQLEYDLVVSPGADPGLIEFELEGIDRMRVDARGDLVLHLGNRELRQHRPRIYQEANGAKRELEGGYVLRGRNRAGFRVTAYDPGRTLVIDPVLSYSSYLGGSAADAGSAIAVDASGNAYLAGITESADFPVPGGLRQRYSEFGDAFVAKLNAAGTALIYATYLGGSGRDRATGIAVDSSGNAYITGETTSSDFPLSEFPYQRYYAGGMGDAFVVKLDAQGSGLVYSTYLGGPTADAGCGITVDAAGHVYAVGETYSGLSQPAILRVGPGGEADVFVVKMSPTGTTLVYSAVFGGTGSDSGCAIKVGETGSAYVAGDTASSDFPVTSGVVRPRYGGGQRDPFVARLNPQGTALVFATYLGGALEDRAYGLALDAAGNAYVTGWTESGSFPTTPGAYRTVLRGIDAFLLKLNPTGTELAYSTLLGGSGDDAGYAVALDAAGNAVLTGYTTSADFPVTSDAAQVSLKGLRDAFVAVLGTDGSPPQYSTYLGGSNMDEGLGVAVDGAGACYVAGSTGSSDFPTTASAFRRTYGRGESDAFMARIALRPNLAPEGVVNAASYVGGAVAPGEIVTLFGSAIGPPQFAPAQLNAAGLVSTSLAGTQVLFDNTAAPLLYVSANQASAIVPYSLYGQTATQIQVDYRGARSNPVTVLVAAAVPGIFTLDFSGRGPGAIRNEDMSVNSPENPARRGSVVMIFATGEGQTRPPGVDGKIITDVLYRPLLDVSVLIGGVPAQHVEYAGSAPTAVAGFLQVNARIPDEVAPGKAVPVVLKVGNAQSQPGVTMAIE